MFKILILAMIVITFAAAVGTSTGRAVRGLMDDLGVYGAAAKE